MSGQLGDGQNKSRKFGVKSEDLVGLVELYKNRKYDEDLRALRNKFDGTEGLTMKLNCDPVNGIVPDDLEERSRLFGNNSFTLLKRTSFFMVMLMVLRQLVFFVLTISGIVTLIISMVFDEDYREIAWIEGISILSAALIVASIIAWDHYKKENLFVMLNTIAREKHNYFVNRNGNKEEICEEDIKVGDLIQINPGMLVP
jgi:magnesium-transporting ATPase (P-type)